MEGLSELVLGLTSARVPKQGHPRAKSANATMSALLTFCVLDKSNREVFCLSYIDWVRRSLLVKAIKLCAAINGKPLHTSWSR